jgi:2-iminoacetate synthase ThiH
MSGVPREQRIKKAVEDRLYDILRRPRDGEKKKDVPKEEIVALSLAIKYLAVSAKLGEAEWGKDLQELQESGLDDSAGQGAELLDDEFPNDF